MVDYKGQSLFEMMPGEILYEPLDLQDLKREQRRLAKLLDSHDVVPPTPLRSKRNPMPNNAYLMKIRKHLDPLKGKSIEDGPHAPPPSSMGMSEETIRRGFNYVKDKNTELFRPKEDKMFHKQSQTRGLGKLPNKTQTNRLTRSLNERNHTEDDFGYKTFSTQMRKSLESNAKKNIKTASEAIEAHKEKKRREYDVRIPQPDDSFFRESPVKPFHTTKDVTDESDTDSSPTFRNRKSRPRNRRRNLEEDEKENSPVPFNYSHGKNPVGDDFMDEIKKYESGKITNSQPTSRDSKDMGGLIRVTSFISEKSDSEKVNRQCTECGDSYYGMHQSRLSGPFLCSNCNRKKRRSDSDSNHRSRSESFARSRNNTFTRNKEHSGGRSRSASPRGTGNENSFKDESNNDPSNFLSELNQKFNDGMFDYDKTVPSLDTVSQKLVGLDDDENLRDESLAFPPDIPILPTEKKVVLKPRRDQYRDAYIKALSAVRGAALPRESWMLGTGTSRAFVFSYFQAWPTKKRKPEENETSEVKKPKKKVSPMKMIFGKVNPDDYLPGGPRNPLPLGQSLPKLVKEKNKKETKKAKGSKSVKFKK